MTDHGVPDHRVTDLDRLLEVYPDRPAGPSLAKETDELTPAYARFVAASPFAVVATSGPAGLDVSPRGDAPGFVEVRDPRTLVLPDRRGNHRLDTLRNIVADPRIALLFLVPGTGETLRVRGTAVVSTDPDELDRAAVDGKRPASVLVVSVERVYFQCARAVRRSRLWDASSRPGPGAVPSGGEMARDAGALTPAEAERYDAQLAARQESTLY